MGSYVHQTVYVAVWLVASPIEPRRRNHCDYHFEMSIYEWVMAIAECEMAIVLSEIAILTL